MVNKLPREIKLKAKVFFNAVEKHFSFLKKFGYVSKGGKLATGYAVDNIIEVVYENKQLKRQLVLHYEPNDINNKSIDLLTIKFYNKKLKLSKNKLEFDVFLEKYIPHINIDYLNYPAKNDKNSFEENMEASIAGYVYFLKDAGMNLINGAEWEEGLVYDWSTTEDILYKAQKKEVYKNKNKGQNEE